MLRSRRANTHLLVRFNTWTSQRLLNWNPIPKLTIVLIWKALACLKFGKTSNRAVENLLQRKLWVWAANDANFPCFYLSCSWRNALWLNAMHCGKKWWIRKFVAPYIFLLNPDYVAARSPPYGRSAAIMYSYQILKTLKKLLVRLLWTSNVNTVIIGNALSARLQPET